MALPEKSNYNSLGGEIINYSDVEDPNTDLDAEFSNETRLDVAGMTNTCAIAIFSFVYDGSAATIGNTELDYTAVYGRATDYKPIITRSAIGNFLITLPANIQDARGNTRAINIRWGQVNSESIGYLGSFRRLTANTARVFVSRTNSAGVVDPPVNERITVWIY